MNLKKKLFSVFALFLGMALSLQSPILFFTGQIVQAQAKTFKDVQGHWAKETIEWALQKGIASGYGDGTFKPNQHVTEAEFLSMLIRIYQPDLQSAKEGHWADAYYAFAKEMNYPVLGEADLKIRDKRITRLKVAELISSTQGVNYQGNDAIRYVLGHHFASGNDPNKVTINSFNPNGYLTRAEAVQFIKNLVEFGKGELLARPHIPSRTSLLPPIPVDGGSIYITYAEFVRDAVIALYGKPKSEAESHWADPYYDFAESIGASGIGGIYSDTNLRDREMARGGAARIIYQLIHKTATADTDAAVRYLYQTNQTCGFYTNKGDYFENFNPAGRISRVQAAEMIEKAKKVKEGQRLPACKNLGTSTGFKETLKDRFIALNKKMKRNYQVSDEYIPGYGVIISGNGLMFSYTYDEWPLSMVTEHWKIEIVGKRNTTVKDIDFIAQSLLQIGGLNIGEQEIKTILQNLLINQKQETIKKKNLTILTGRLELPPGDQVNYYVEWAPESFTEEPKPVKTADFVPEENQSRRFVAFNPEGQAVHGTMIEHNGIYYLPLEIVTEWLGGTVQSGQSIYSATVKGQHSPSFYVEYGLGAMDMERKEYVPLTRLSDDEVDPIMDGRTLMVPYDFFNIALQYPVEQGPGGIVYIGNKPETYTERQNIDVRIAYPHAAMRVNGEELPQEAPLYYINDILYAPLDNAVRKMGDQIYDKNDYYFEKEYMTPEIRSDILAILKNRNGKYEFIEVKAGDSLIKINGKYVPLYTEQKKDENQNPVVAKAFKMEYDNHIEFYVPYDFFSTVLNYPVEIRPDGAQQVVFIGTIPTEKPVYDLIYKPPYGWVPPKVKSVATENFETNQKIIEEEIWRQTDFPFIQVKEGDEDEIARIYFYAWFGSLTEAHEYNKIPYYARALFQFYLPNEYQKLFKIMDDGMNGRDVPEYVKKPFILDGRKIEISSTVNAVGVRLIVVHIGKKSN